MFLGPVTVIDLIMVSEPSPDTYAWETISESLVHSHLTLNHSYSHSFDQKLASICCLALREIDDQLYSQIMRLPSLPTDSFFLETYEAALKATIVLIRTYIFIRLHTLEIFFSRFPVFGLGADAVYPGDLYLQHWTAIMTGRALLMLGYHP